MTKKRLMALILSVVMIVSVFGACNSDNGSSSSSTGTDVSGTTSTTDSGETEAITVMIWDRGTAAPGTTNEDNTLADWIKEQVLENCNVEVTYMSVPRSDSDDKLNIMMAGGSAPDIVFTYDQAIFTNYATSGGLADLTEAYETYGGKIQEKSGEIQYMGEIEETRYAILKQRQGSISRHVQYIRTDWLEALGMDVPTTKDELYKYLYAVKEQNPGGVDNVIPWMMAGETDSEKYYLNFLGSFVNDLDDRSAYIYSENYLAFADGAKEGIRKLNELYNDGIIYSDFVTDTTGDIFKQEISQGNVGFVLGDTTNPIWEIIPVLKENVEAAEMTPISAFELEDGSYRNPAEPLYGMYIMVPQTSQGNANAVVKYLNWMVDPEVAENIQYGPDHTQDEEGIPQVFTEDERNELGYPGNLADYNIMNERFTFAESKEGIVASYVANVNNYWEDEEWFSNAYDIMYDTGHYLYPTYSSSVIEAETKYGANVKTLAVEFVYKLICCDSAQFDSLYDSEYAKLVSAGIEDIFEERASWYDENAA